MITINYQFIIEKFFLTILKKCNKNYLVELDHLLRTNKLFEWWVTSKSYPSVG